jgi:hypothetical protein
VKGAICLDVVRLLLRDGWSHQQCQGAIAMVMVLRIMPPSLVRRIKGFPFRALRMWNCATLSPAARG